MSSLCAWPSMTRLEHLCLSNVAPKPGGNLLTSRKLLQLLVLKSVKLSLACIHTLVVIQSVHLQKNTRTLSSNWVTNGIFLAILWTKLKNSHVSSMPPRPQEEQSIISCTIWGHIMIKTS